MKSDLIDDVSYFLGSDSVKSINGLHFLLIKVLINLVQSAERMEGYEEEEAIYKTIHKAEIKHLKSQIADNRRFHT